MNVRRYSSVKEIAVGDVVRMAESVDCAFSTSIIERITDGYAHLARPIMQVGTLFDQDNLASAWSFAERYSLELTSVAMRYEVFTRGPTGEKDNRTVIVDTRENKV